VSVGLGQQLEGVSLGGPEASGGVRRGMGTGPGSLASASEDSGEGSLVGGRAPTPDLGQGQGQGQLQGQVQWQGQGQGQGQGQWQGQGHGQWQGQGQGQEQWQGQGQAMPGPEGGVPSTHLSPRPSQQQAYHPTLPPTSICQAPAPSPTPPSPPPPPTPPHPSRAPKAGPPPTQVDFRRWGGGIGRWDGTPRTIATPQGSSVSPIKRWGRERGVGLR